MTYSSHFPRRVACGVGLLVWTLFATPTWASMIYEYRPVGSSIVIATLEIESPPASATSGWSTTDPADLIALRLDDSVFGLGTGDLLPTSATVSAAVLSSAGFTLDIGAVALNLTIIPVNPSNPTIDYFLSFLFGVLGDDFIGLSTVTTFPNNNLVFDDLSVVGDWTAAQVPEPGTAALVLIGLAAGRIARRKRR